MSTGLKEELGLGEPKPRKPTHQGDNFKASFRGELDRINKCLQYTAAHAEQAKHDPQVSGRDKLCAAYQAALKRIDPYDAAVARGAIEKVLATANGVQQAVESLKQAVEDAYNAWISRDADFDAVADKIRAMVEWGHDKAAALQQIASGITSQANLRKYKEALQTLEQLLAKIGPIHDEFLRQKAAQEEYDVRLAALEPRLVESATREFISLEVNQQEIESLESPMRDSAKSKDFVTALETIQRLEELVSLHLDEVDHLRELKQQYEEGRAALDARLQEAGSGQYITLAELDQAIADLTSRMEQAAAAEDFDQALVLLSELTGKAEEKITRTAELDAKKQQYEQALTEVQPRLAEAGTGQYETLAELDQAIADLTTRMEKAAGAEDFDQALQLHSELVAKVEERIARVAELDAKKQEYEQARAPLDPKLAEAAAHQHASLAELDQQIADLTSRIEQAATAEGFDQALQLLSGLSSKVEEKLARVAELEAKKQEYEQALAALQPRIAEASQN